MKLWRTRKSLMMVAARIGMFTPSHEAHKNASVGRHNWHGLSR